MNLTRRDFLRASAAILTAHRLSAGGAQGLQDALGSGVRPPVIWLQGQGCNGDSVSLLNSICYMTADELLTMAIDLRFHPTLMAAAGDLAVSTAEATRAVGGHILVIEGAIATGAGGRYCTIWPGMTMLNAVQTFNVGASFIIAVGTCAAYGGVSGGSPNPTGAVGVQTVLPGDARVINIPGCPAHPDWIVGTIAGLLATGQAPTLDSSRRPVSFFGKRIHDYCVQRHVHCGGARADAPGLSQDGCLEKLGCKGPLAYGDCYARRFNSGEKGRFGVNWCIGARSPCIGCVQPTFPDGMSPFFK